MSAAENIAKIEAAMLSNPGVDHLELGGRIVEWDRDALMEELEYWKQKLASENAVSNRLPFKQYLVRPGKPI